MATALSLDDRIEIDGRVTSVRELYLRNLQFESPIPEFASALSVNLSLITSDGFIVVSKRAIDGIGGYSGHIAHALNECMNLVSDRSSNGTLSLLATAQRGINNELNIEVAEDEITFFTVGVDPQHYFWGVTGLIRSKEFTRADIQTRRSIGSKEHWESTQLYFLPHNPSAVAQFMRDISQTEKWQPIGIVCLIQTMIAEFGIKATERALCRYAPPRRRIISTISGTND